MSPRNWITCCASIFLCNTCEVWNLFVHLVYYNSSETVNVGCNKCRKQLLTKTTGSSWTKVLHWYSGLSHSLMINRLHSMLVSYPTRWSFSFILGPLHWSSSWQWQPSIAGCRLFQTLLWTQLADFAQFFCKMYLLYMWPSRKTCLVWFGWVLPP